MKDDLTSIPNIGPATAKALIAAGITDAQMLRDKGAHEACRALLENGQRPHFISYYLLHMALQGRPWNDCRGQEKDDLRAQFDALVMQVKAAPLSAIEAALNEIGLPSAHGGMLR